MNAEFRLVCKLCDKVMARISIIDGQSFQDVMSAVFRAQKGHYLSWHPKFDYMQASDVVVKNLPVNFVVAEEKILPTNGQVVRVFVSNEDLGKVYDKLLFKYGPDQNFTEEHYLLKTVERLTEERDVLLYGEKDISGNYHYKDKVYHFESNPERQWTP